jgi:hypothetical protein
LYHNPPSSFVLKDFPHTNQGAFSNQFLNELFFYMELNPHEKKAQNFLKFTKKSYPEKLEFGHFHAPLR